MCLYKVLENVVCEFLKTCSTNNVFGGHVRLNVLNLNIRFISKYIGYDIFTDGFLSLKLFVFCCLVNVEL